MRLVRTDADGRGEAIDLAGESVIVGRQTTRGAQIDHPTVSREHARFFVRDGVWQIADLNSSNGTFVNGAKVTKATLKAGDVVRLGNVEFKLNDAAKPAAAADEIRLEDDFFAAPSKPAAPKPSAPVDVDEIQLDEGPVTSKFPTPAKTPMGAGSISGAGAAAARATLPTPGPNLSTMPGATGAPPPPKRLSTQNLLRKSDEAAGGGVLRHDIAQYGGFMKFVIVAACAGLAYGLYLGVMKLTETVVPERTEAPATTDVEDEATDADK